MIHTGVLCCLRLVAVMLISAVVFAGSVSASDWQEQSRVKSVYDGDTVRLADGSRIRLAGIDTPERDPEQFHAYASTARLKELLAASGYVVKVRIVSKDRHGRQVAELIGADGVSLSEQMLREGMATFYFHQELPERLAGRLMAAQRQAIAQRAGLWKRLLASELNRQKYVGNRNSHRFFSMSCPEGARIGRRNRVNFNSLEEAYTFGYAPARPCNIFPLARDMQ